MKYMSIILAMVLCFAGTTQAAEAQDVKRIDPLIKPSVLDKTKAVKVEILQVTYPATGEGKESQFAYENKKIKVTVRFNIDVDQNTVAAGSTVKLDFPKAPNTAGQITWVNSREFIWVQSAQSIHDICKFTPGCAFQLTLTDGIKSKDGYKLDGDKNNQPGGDFTRNYIFIE
jgi:hypothetical protein